MDCFKSYDIRGVLGESVTEEIFYKIGRAVVIVLEARRIVVGRDARASSTSLAAAVQKGIRDQGCEVFDIGLAGTEEVYFGTPHFEADAGIVITASHNPINYNGMKIVGGGSRPLDLETEFLRIKEVAEENFSPYRNAVIGSYRDLAAESKNAYARRILDFVNFDEFRNLKVVVNCGNGAAGPALAEIRKQLELKQVGLEIIPQFEDPDSTFPHGIPNPLLPENHHWTKETVLASGADFGVAFDGDFDRCFFFDSDGLFVPGEVMVGILAEAFSEQEAGSSIVHDPRLVFQTREICGRAGLTAIQSPTGHLFMKKVMRESNAVYGGELSAHHYFRDFHFCDSGMIPWLLVSMLMARSEVSLNSISRDRQARFPSSEELNFSVKNGGQIIADMEKEFVEGARAVEKVDGLSVEFDEWRFNLRSSNTEPLLRLNVETREDQSLLVDRIKTLSEKINKISTIP